MATIRFYADYDTSENLLFRFQNNYIIDDDQLNFTNDNSYDYAVVFNSTKEVLNPNARIITIIQEPTFAESHKGGRQLINSDYLIIHDARKFEEYYNLKLGGKVIESPSFMFFNDHVHHSFFEHSEEVVKTKKLSMIISGLYFSRGNYKRRIEVLMKILRSGLEIDIYGRSLNIVHPNYKGSIAYKHMGLLPYEYSIAIENTNEKNYITEKFFDCALCNTTPIYNGAPNIGQVYDSRYFKTIDLESPTIVDDIKTIISQPSVGTKVNKEIYLKHYNLYTKLKEIVCYYKIN